MRGMSERMEMKHAVVLAGLATVGLAFTGSPGKAATQVVTQVAQLIQVEACEDCTPVQVPANIVAPEKRKIKVTRVWSLGVLH